MIHFHATAMSGTLTNQQATYFSVQNLHIPSKAALLAGQEVTMEVRGWPSKADHDANFNALLTAAYPGFEVAV